MRLRGFYKDDRPVTDAEKISRLEDYLLEYCSYGCAYFVLENAEPRRASFDKKSSPKQQEEGNRSAKRGSRQNRRNRSKNQPREREQEQKQKSISTTAYSVSLPMRNMVRGRPSSLF